MQDLNWFVIVGLVYAALVATKYISYLKDTKRMLGMMEVMNRIPRHGITYRQFFVSFAVITAIGLWFTVWYELPRTGVRYFGRVDDEHLYKTAIRLSVPA